MKVIDAELQINALQEQQQARLNQIASSDPVWQRLAGKLEILQAMLKDGSSSESPESEDNN